ncbi:MAG: molecular chaperone HtpG [Lachnospiraceae bacterium]|nr:molecular chaperone HtpG [Lachnospiraceae bacterium]MDE6626207.1 molecular chaperone HtpG [Lachnospiraceae bacterium]
MARKKKGSLSIDSENIFPIIKKWLYSDHDIFIREVVSNACDAVTKLRKLTLIGEYEETEDMPYRIDVITSAKDKTITFIDNGIGMTADEVNEYINQIAFSGASDFLEKYKDKATDDQIIGHFGLGFYSTFMVADKVTIDTLSYQENAEPVFWECDGGTDYTMSGGSRDIHGTEITLYLNEDSYEFANEYRVKEVLEKYCSFMPEEIYYTNADEAKETDDEVVDSDVVAEPSGNPADTEDSQSSEEGDEADSGSTADTDDQEPKEKPINDTKPLWTKHPNDCTEEEYKEFYRKVFLDFKEPLFWIHLNMDYPFNLKGILYFPKFNTEYDTLEGTIKLYNNQVFIADNIKEVIPEFLLLLKGVIDCPDLPLNVSRSALQNDGFVKKISDYITKKVADKLAGMFKTERESYEGYWDDLSPFIKFGCLKDDKFDDKMKDYILYKDIDGKYLTLSEYLEAGKEQYENTIFYTDNEQVQSQYINMFREQKINAVVLTHNIDTPFITHQEQKNDGVKFVRIDSDITNTFKEDVSEEELKETTDKLSEIFKKALDNDKLTVKVEKLKNPAISSMITLAEETRRMQDMMKMYSMGGAMDPSMFGGDSQTLVLNANNNLVQYILDNPESENTDTVCQQLYDLALLAHAPLKAEAMTKFIARSNEILTFMTKG